MKIEFVPKTGTEIDLSGFPRELVGDGFIDLRLWEADSLYDSAIYLDQFKEDSWWIHM